MRSTFLMSRFRLLPLLCLCGALSAHAQSPFQRPSDAVEYRQAGFELMGTHFRRLNAMAQGKVAYDAKAVEENLSLIHI